MNLKKGILVGLLAGGLFCMTNAFSLAQGAPPPGAPPQGRPGGGPGGRGGMGRMTPEQRLEKMGKDLKLTDAQKKKIKPILEDSGKKMMALRDDQATPREQKRPKMEAIRKESNDKIMAILTKEQKAKMLKMEEENRKRMEEWRKQRGGPGAPPPGAPGAPPKP